MKCWLQILLQRRSYSWRRTCTLTVRSLQWMEALWTKFLGAEPVGTMFGQGLLELLNCIALAWRLTLKGSDDRWRNKMTTNGQYYYFLLKVSLPNVDHLTVIVAISWSRPGSSLQYPLPRGHYYASMLLPTWHALTLKYLWWGNTQGPAHSDIRKRKHSLHNHQAEKPVGDFAAPYHESLCS